MIHPSNPREVTSSEINPTICLDCGQTYFGTMKCPSCREKKHPLSPKTPATEEPEITLPDVPEQPEPAKTNPTICLECGQTFIGTIECPSCEIDARNTHHKPPVQEPEATLTDDPIEEEETIEAQILLDEMREQGFEVTQAW